MTSEELNYLQAKRFISMLLLLSIVFPAFSIQRLSAAVPEFGSVRVEVENNGTQDSYVPMAPTRLGNKLLVYWQDMAASYQEHYTVINPDGSLGSMPPVTLSPRTNDLSDTVLHGALSNGNMVVYWYSGGSGKGFTDTYFKIIDPNGNEVVGATKINSSPGELNRFTKFAELSNGNLAFVWATSGGEYALRRFQPDGTAVDGAQLSVTSLAGISSSQYSHDIAANGNGKFMIMISYSNPNYVGMIFDNDASAPNQVNGQNSFVISSRGENGNEIQWLKVLPDGRFLTVYQKITGVDSSSRSVAFRIYNQDGTPYADETVIRPLNSWGTISEPIILPDGGFALSYSYLDYNTEPDTYQTYFESYSSTGTFQHDLSAGLPAVNDQYGAVFPFQDVDGNISFLVNDKESGDPTYDSWLLRHGESTHTVTFQDWDGTGLKTETVNHGAAATAPADPSRTGYTFTGWSAAFANVTADLTVTAQYDANEYTVSFESNGGSAVAAVQADYGTKLTAPAAPTRDGYSFDGWYKDAGLTTAWDFGTDTVPVDGMTLYAKWTIKTYTVTFQDWDGTGLKTETVNHGTAATAPANPTRTGYTFTGWSAAIANVTADLTVTAQYDANEYTVSFESNGGSAVADVQADYSTKLTAPAAPTRDGYTFGGWYQDAGLSTAWNFSTDSIPANDMTLYAKWTIKTYTVTFQDWDGTGLKTETVNHGAAATAPANPSRSGYTFTGWSAAFANVTADTIITAQYSVNAYTVSFESNGGSAVAAVQADYGTKLTAPAAPTREGYRFDGWYKDAGLTTRWIFSTDTMPANAITLYSKWTAVYKVTYNGNGHTSGSVPADGAAYEHAATAAVLGNTGSLARSGYTFGGWNTKADGSGTSYAAADTFTIDHANVTLYARWNQIPVAPPATPSPAPSPAAGTTGVDVLVNGKVENAGTATTNQVNGQTVTVISVDQKKLEDKLAAEGLQSVVTIPSNTKSDVVVGELNGRMVKNMESKQAVLEIRTDRATYTLPAEQINIDSVSGQFGRSVELQDIKVRIEIAAPPAETARLVENAAEKGSFSLVMPAIDFTVRAANGGETIEVTKFNAYVERTIAIPDGVDPSKITTGIVVEPDGTVRHVPTKVVVVDGKYYARINSLTNSTYSVVWHPLEFEDMKLHWAKEAVNDTGSRMIIEGDGNGSFHPDREITRAEFAAIVVRALGLKLESGDGSFPDVKESDWYNGAINTAYAYRLITGFEDGTFRPNDKITREQATTIIAKAMTITKLRGKLASGASDSLMNSYRDAKEVANWARIGLMDTLQAGIVTGRNGSELAPKALITRAEVAVMVQRLLKKSDLI